MIRARKGKFPGMAAKRRFKVVLVGPGVGVGTAPVGKAIEIDYDGRAVNVNLRRVSAG
jgi:alpha-D-xyloside xylohydrolase